MSEQRKQWVGRRFGNIDEKILGQINEVRDISWPDLVKEYEVKGNLLKYQMVGTIEESAEQIAGIYRNSVDEIVGNSDYEWHHYSEEIKNRVRTTHIHNLQTPFSRSRAADN